jgi:hypothetical protein
MDAGDDEEAPAGSALITSFRRIGSRWSLWLAGGLVAVAFLLFAGVFDNDHVEVAVGVLALALVVLWADTAAGRQALGRTRTVKGWGLEISLDAAQSVEESLGAARAEDAPGEDSPSEAPTAADWLALQLKLEQKLVYIGDHWLSPGQEPTIARLRVVRLLSSEEAETAFQLQRLTPSDLAHLSGDAAADLVRAAGVIAGNIRAVVLNALVRKRLADAGWKVAKRRRRGRLPDLVATRDGVVMRVAPTFALSDTSPMLEGAVTRTARRLARDDAPRGFVVVPNTATASPGPRADGAVEVMKLEPFMAQFAPAPEDAP